MVLNFYSNNYKKIEIIIGNAIKLIIFEINITLFDNNQNKVLGLKKFKNHW